MAIHDDDVAAVKAATDFVAVVTGYLQLRKVGLDEVFAGKMFSGMDQPRSKPAPDVYLAAAAHLGLDPVRAAVVEDTVPGVTAGVAAGATVFGFCPPGSPAHHPPKALLDAGATHIFTDMADLPALLPAADRKSYPSI